MRIGLLTDIHESVDPLRQALAHFEAERVDQIVVLGDVADLFHGHVRLNETCRWLHDAQAIGVWGNHDFALCHSVAEELSDRFEPVVHQFLASLRPRLELEECLFMHVEPWLDPQYMPDLWHFGNPELPEERERLFSQTSHRVMFGGHYHRGWHVTPAGCRTIDEGVVDLGLGRHFVVVNALCDGHFAIYDTSAKSLCASRL
jgi:hypothetical protein